MPLLAVTVSDDEVDTVEVSIRSSEEKEEMKSKSVDKEKADGKDGKKSESPAMNLKEKW